MKKLQLIAFLTKALAEQERIIMKVINDFVTKIDKDDRLGTGKLNMTKWYNIYTFDILRKMTFGKSFYCIETDVLRNPSYFSLNFLSFDFFFFLADS